MTLRADLAAHIQAALGDGYAVYDSGADVIKTPCVVINPSNPYQVPKSFGADATVQTFLDLFLVTNRTSPSDALNHLDAMRLEVAAAIKTFLPRGTWINFGGLGSTEVGGTEYATGVLQSVFMHEEEGA